MQLKNSSELFIFSHRLADVAGDLLRQHFNTDLLIEKKADLSPVTQADREVETALRSLIEHHYPEHGIVGEEWGTRHESADYQWVIDPIDGTKAFIAGIPTFTTLIALLYQNVPIIGIIDQPISQERFSAVSGKQTHMLHNQKKLTEANIATTSTGYFSPTQEIAFTKLQAASANTTFGGDAYAYAMLTKGTLDIVVDAGMKPYDFCALAPVIDNSGGIITDWNGMPLTLHSDGTVLAAANRELHTAALALLRE